MGGLDREGGDIDVSAEGASCDQLHAARQAAMDVLRTAGVGAADAARAAWELEGALEFGEPYEVTRAVVALGRVWDDAVAAACEAC